MPDGTAAAIATALIPSHREADGGRAVPSRLGGRKTKGAAASKAPTPSSLQTQPGQLPGLSAACSSLGLAEPMSDCTIWLLGDGAFGSLLP